MPLSFSTGINDVSLDAALGLTPTAIEHVKTEKTAGFCYGVSWTGDDWILCAQNGQVEVRHTTDLKLQNTLIFPDIASVVSASQCGETFLTKVTAPKTKKYITYSGSMEELTQQVLHSEEAETPSTITHLSANKDYIASIDFVNKALKVFSFTTEEHLFDIQLADFQSPYGVHLTADAVLVTDYTGGKLCKYALTPSPDPTWTCTGLPSPAGITTDGAGFIYLCNTRKPIINIISPVGKCLSQLKKVYEHLADQPNPTQSGPSQHIGDIKSHLKVKLLLLTQSQQAQNNTPQ